MNRKEQEKLFQLIIFFSQNTQICGKVKLFKLMYLADFECFRQTGSSITGMEYVAWKYGPVPTYLNSEIEEPSEEFDKYFTISREEFDSKYNKYNPRECVVPRMTDIEFDDNEFTKRELRIIQELATQYRDADAQKLIDVTHQKDGAWDKVWKDGRGRDERIPYELFVEDLENEKKERILSLYEENQNFVRARKLDNCG